ncbi:peptide chain release factor 2, putative [Babesia caballi]|uniref:Peptide chain release factor 2, putative n=1 Tax=Babesia caballi TaxID=5871 RepID=A0AAV4M2N2_BABCB|nr:peptide chain release factor 2, putative [Babesia caballi]
MTAAILALACCILLAEKALLHTTVPLRLDSTVPGFLSSTPRPRISPASRSTYSPPPSDHVYRPVTSYEPCVNLPRRTSATAVHQEGVTESAAPSAPSNQATDDTLTRLRKELRQRHGTEFPLREHYIKGTGPGGQKVNKSSNCVQLIQYSPALGTNVVVKCHMHRSLLDNRIEATRTLLHRLDEAEEQQSRAWSRLREKEKRRILKLSPAEKARNKFEKQLRAEKKANRRKRKIADDWF